MLLQLPWFETPIVFDIRAKPRSIASLTGTKGSSAHLEPTRTSLSDLRDMFRPANGQHHLPCAVETTVARVANNIQGTWTRL